LTGPSLASEQDDYRHTIMPPKDGVCRDDVEHCVAPARVQMRLAVTDRVPFFLGAAVAIDRAT